MDRFKSSKPRRNVRLSIDQLEARRMMTADIDGDGTVGFTDFLMLSAEYGQNVPLFSSPTDIDGNGEVGFSDFLILSRNYGSTAITPQGVFGIAPTNSEPVQGSASTTEEWNALSESIRPGEEVGDPPINLEESTLVVVTLGERNFGISVSIEWILLGDESVEVGYRQAIGGPPPPPGTQFPIAAVSIPATTLPVRFQRLETLALP